MSAYRIAWTGGAHLLLLGSLAVPASAQSAQRSDRLVLEAALGPRTSESTWSIGTAEGARSILTYRNVRVGEARIGGRYRIAGDRRSGLDIVFHGAAGRILSGSAQDSDFTLEARETSRSVSDIVGAGLLRFALGLGVDRELSGDGAIRLSGSAGYERNGRTLRKQRGRQVIPDNYASWVLWNLDSRYSARWAGPWIAVQPSVRLGTATWSIRGVGYIANRYRAEGSWNLRDDLVQPRSFTQRAAASGYDLRLRFSRPIEPDLFLAIEVEHAWRSAARGGTDLLFFKDGRVVRSTLRGATWRSSGLTIGLSSAGY